MPAPTSFASWYTGGWAQWFGHYMKPMLAQAQPAQPVARAVEAPAAEPAPSQPSPSQGTASGERINGTHGNDWFWGLGGNDTIQGMGGTDTLEGGEGNDRLMGGADADVLWGGAGRDVFSFQSVQPLSGSKMPQQTGPSDSAPGARDVIMDFVQGEDRIDLAQYGVNWTLEHRFEGGNTIVDFTSAFGQEVEIEVRGLHNLTHADFVLG